MGLVSSIRAAWGGVAKALGGAGKPDPERRLQAVPQPFAMSEIVEQRILNDDSVYSVFNLFTDVLFGSGWRWEGADTQRCIDLTNAIEQAPGFPQLLDEIGASPFQRYAAAEIVWQTSPKWVPLKYRVLPHEVTRISLDEFSEATQVIVSTSAGMQPLPMENVLFAAYRPTLRHPLGISCYDHLKEVIDMKRRTDASLVRYVERFAVPSRIGWYGPNTTEPEQTALLEMLKKLQSASVGVAPGGTEDDKCKIETLEVGSAQGIQVAVDMLKMYERRIARAVLGSVLSIFEAEFGTRAQAETHLEMLKKVISSYQKDIEGPVNEQIVKPVMRYNVGDADVVWHLNAPAFADLQKLGAWIADLAQAGVIDPVRDANAIRGMFNMDPLNQEDLEAVSSDASGSSKA